MSKTVILSNWLLQQIPEMLFWASTYVYYRFAREARNRRIRLQVSTDDSGLYLVVTPENEDRRVCYIPLEGVRLAGELGKVGELAIKYGVRILNIEKRHQNKVRFQFTKTGLLILRENIPVLRMSTENSMPPGITGLDRVARVVARIPTEKWRMLRWDICARDWTERSLASLARGDRIDPVTSSEAANLGLKLAARSAMNFRRL